MSKYLTFADIVFADREVLLAALAEIGYGREKIEEGMNLPLYGYRGDKRAETAEIVIRRQFTGIQASNDIGFKKVSGGYSPIVSEYDERTLRNGHFRRDLRVAYAQQAVTKIQQELRGTIQIQRVAATAKAAAVTRIRLRY